MKYYFLASGSGGNATALVNENDEILLIDCGIAISDIKSRLSQVGLDFNNVKKVLMIGDTENDILCGKNAKCYTCGVTWCVSTSNDFKSWKADEIVSNPLELIKLGEKYEDRL